ncbi:hypothetical protein BKA69DRAFT_410058 [Paraphysoderma sedebokerense]|nr:hypothetical protein BKA69DRAFT_410058 [Paraphysoderma sedebokerense]
MKYIAFYVSGHGFGHATRALQLCVRLLSSSHVSKIWIISAAPEFIFKSVLSNRCIYRNRLIDSGVIQTDAVTVDPDKSFEDLRYVMENKDTYISEEMDFLKKNDVSLVLTDASYIPIRAAKLLGTKRAVVSNFTWDHIYSAMLPYVQTTNQPLMKNYIRSITSDYSDANILFRLQGAAPIPFEKSVPIADIPIFGRKSVTPRSTLLSQNSIEPDTRILLVSFGGQEVNWGKLDTHIALPAGWVGVVCGLDESSSEKLPHTWKGLPKHAYIPDWVNAADAVLGKLGYGTCSEVIIHKKPMIYVPRMLSGEAELYGEEAGLYELMIDQGYGLVEMKKSEFSLGAWKASVSQAMEQLEVMRHRPLNENGDIIFVQSLENWYNES